MFPERLETERLTFERLTREGIDVRTLYRICSADPDIDEVTRYVTWDPHETVKETAEFVDRAVTGWEDDETATYVVRPREGEDGAGEIAGLTSLDCDWDRRTGNLGMWLRKRYWGRGYSGERAEALLAIAFETLELEVVAVTHHADNEKSRRAIEKYVEAHGGRREGLLRNWISHGAEVADEYRYTISREEYREARS